MLNHAVVLKLRSHLIFFKAAINFIIRLIWAEMAIPEFIFKVQLHPPSFKVKGNAHSALLLSDDIALMGP